jgi:RNA polymerase sigma-70 factor (ECF subfamily)
VQAQRPEAWQRLADLYGPVVYRWCRQSGVEREEAADLVQEVFSAVAIAVPSFRRDAPSGSFRAWLAGITRHKIADYYRRRQNRPVARGGTDAHEQMMQVSEPVEKTESTFTDEADSLIYRRAIDLVRAEFENRTWEAFWKTTVDGRPPRDVADDLGMTVLAVYKAKSRVLRRLRQELGGLVG